MKKRKVEKRRNGRNETRNNGNIEERRGKWKVEWREERNEGWEKEEIDLEIKKRMKEGPKKGRKKKEEELERRIVEGGRKEKEMNMKVQVKCHSYIKGLLFE
jgi:hypothetical protein